MSVTPVNSVSSQPPPPVSNLPHPSTHTERSVEQIINRLYDQVEIGALELKKGEIELAKKRQKLEWHRLDLWEMETQMQTEECAAELEKVRERSLKRKMEKEDHYNSSKRRKVEIQKESKTAHGALSKPPENSASTPLPKNIEKIPAKELDNSPKKTQEVYANNKTRENSGTPNLVTHNATPAKGGSQTRHSAIYPSVYSFHPPIELSRNFNSSRSAVQIEKFSHSPNKDSPMPFLPDWLNFMPHTYPELFSVITDIRNGKEKDVENVKSTIVQLLDIIRKKCTQRLNKPKLAQIFNLSMEVLDKLPQAEYVQRGVAER